MAILVIGFMTAGVVASFTRVGAEIGTVDNQRGQTAAFAVAEAGLADFMNNGPSIPPGQTTASRSYSYPDGGSAQVEARRLHTTGQQSVILIRSTGTIPGRPGRPGAVRTVAQFARSNIMTMQVYSAWTSLSGVSKNGNSGTFEGRDASSPSCSPADSVRAGIAVPDGMAFGRHIENVSRGDPPIDYLGSQQEAADGIDMNWGAVISPTAPAIAPSVIVCFPGTAGFDARRTPCGSFPTDFTGFPSILINGSASLPRSGQGTLIVTGNLTMNGNQNWTGVILVGGRITDNGQGTIRGAVVTGLNMTLGETIGESFVGDPSTANGTKRYQYDSCGVRNALAAASSGYVPIRNAWVDNWAAW
jgi:hypothetical protein